MKKWLFIFSVFGFLGFVTASIALESAFSKNLTKKEDVFLEANQMDYDQNNAIVYASGKVEVQKGTNVVFADQIIYDQKQNVVVAQGNVSYIGADGNVVFTDKIILKDDLKSGVIKFFRAKLEDGSLIAAAEGQRIDDKHAQLTKAVYSPCPLCATSPNPQWQIKSEKVEMDDVQQRIKYEDAWLEVYGLPVIYTPYFSHPTPNADRKTGFLTPSFRTDSNLGAAVRAPYYINIAPNMEAIVAPTVTSKNGLILDSKFKHLTNYGEYEVQGSITRPRGFTELTQQSQGMEKDLRGNLKAKGLFDLSPHWDVGFDGQYTSDDTYLRRYYHDYTDLITSSAWLEHINERDYAKLQAVHFRGLLQEDNQDTIPYVLPYVRSKIESNYGVIPAYPKSKMTIDTTAFNLQRRDGDSNQRGSIKAGLNIPVITTGGHIFEADASLRADQYSLDGATQTKSNVSRFIPEVSATWRYPLISSNGKTRTLLEPIVKLIATPNTDYNKNIPNEDSQDVEFSELNVFHDNRYRGVDRVESGMRAHYGLRGGYFADDYALNYVVGQNYRFKEPINSPRNSGIEDNLSDIVGRIGGNYKEVVDLTYRFRLDQKTLSSRRNEIDLGIDYYPVQFHVGYFNLNYDFTNNADNREEISGDAKVNINKEWSVIAGGTRNIAQDRSVYTRAGLAYEGDCTTIQAVVRKDYIEDRDAKSTTSFDFNIALKNLGEI